MDDVPTIVLAVPLYIALPPHPITRKKVYVLVNVEVQVIGGVRARVKTQWTKVQPPAKFQGALNGSTLMVPKVEGVTVFMPNEALASPLFMFINYIQGRRVRPGLLIGVTVSGTPPSFDDIEVETSVEVNADCRTVYSGEVSVEGMGVEETRLDIQVDGRDLEEARAAVLLEMEVRGESLGPTLLEEESDTKSGLECGIEEGKQGSQSRSEDDGDSGLNEKSGRVREATEEVNTPCDICSKDGEGKEEHCVEGMYA